MSDNQEYAAPVPYWAENLSRQDIIGELTAIAGELARADDGRLLLTPAARKDLEDRREMLKGELARLDAEKQHQNTEAAPVGNADAVLALGRRLAAQVEEGDQRLARLLKYAEEAGLRAPEGQKLEFLDPNGRVLSVHGTQAQLFAATE